MERIDFLVVGGVMPSGEVALCASNAVYEITVTADYDHYDSFLSEIRSAPFRKDVKIAGIMRDYVLVGGGSYREAWDGLFNIWSPPDPTGRKAISEQHRVLPPGPK